MNFRIQRASASLVPRFCCAIFLFMSLLFQKSTAQNAALDPSEVEVLNSLFKQWNMQSTTFWNMSGEPCSGSAINETQFYDDVNKQAIMCNCTYNDNTTCHITHLKVLSLNKTGEIPEELTTLTYLMVLRLDKNYFTGPLPSFIGIYPNCNYCHLLTMHSLGPFQWNLEISRN